MRIIITSDNCLRYEGDDGTVAFVGDIVDPEIVDAMKAIKAVFDGYKTPEQIAVDTAIGLALSAADETQVAEILPLIETWEPDKSYQAGKHVFWIDTVYRIVQSHKSQADWEPELTPALYTVANKTTTDPVETVPEWVQPTGTHDAYGIGDQVKFEGKTYESVINANTHSPVAYPAGWKEIE